MQLLGSRIRVEGNGVADAISDSSDACTSCFFPHFISCMSTHHETQEMILVLEIEKAHCI